MKEAVNFLPEGNFVVLYKFCSVTNNVCSEAGDKYVEEYNCERCVTSIIAVLTCLQCHDMVLAASGS